MIYVPPQSWLSFLQRKAAEVTYTQTFSLKQIPGLWLDMAQGHFAASFAFWLLPPVIPFNFCISCLYSAFSANPRKIVDAKPSQKINFPPVIKGCTKVIATICLRSYLSHKPSKLRHSTPEKAPVDISVHKNSLKSSLAWRPASPRCSIKLTKVRGLISFIFVL